MSLIRLLLSVALLWAGADSARILAIIPTTSYSHQVFFRPLWTALAERGHEVLLITTDPINNASIANLKEIDLSAGYRIWNAGVMDMVNSNDDKVAGIRVMLDKFFKISRVQLSDPAIKQLYDGTDETFDLIFIEYLMPTMLVFKHKFDVPFIGVASMDTINMGHAAVGNPQHSVLYPNVFLGLGDDMTFMQRLRTVCFDWYMWSLLEFTLIPTLDEMVRETIGDGVPSVATLGQRVDMLFVNVNPLFYPIRPYVPATISLAGGLHEVAQQSLPKELADFMDAAHEGVIYFSLGSNVKSKDISLKTRAIIRDTFAQLPYKVLWKFEEDMPAKPDNVKIMKWLPQQDVLRHRNILAFVTQGGVQSLEESLYARVPMVVMPFFADQDANAQHVIAKGLGVLLSHRTLTVAAFKAALLEVIENDSYRKRVKELADLTQDQPMKPLDSAIWWTEYVLRHKGAQHLHGPTIPSYQRLYLDIIAFLTAVLVLVSSLLYFVCTRIAGRLCGRTFSGKKEEREKMKKK